MFGGGLPGPLGGWQWLWYGTWLEVRNCVKSTYWSDRIASTSALRIAGSSAATTMEIEVAAAEAPR